MKADQARQATKRNNESPDERAARLTADQGRQVERRQNESPAERAARLTANQERQAAIRKNESPEERQLRLDNARTRRLNVQTAKGTLYRPEVPNKDADPKLYDIILRHNIHGPCGNQNSNSICMQDGLCKKRFPKCFQDFTDNSGDGYPLYRRRDNTNEQHVIRNQAVHNGWIVPYNVFLSKTFEAHINVEMCHTVSAVKYLCKYFTKGHDRARVGFTRDANNTTLSLNEVKEFVDTRCVTPPEAMWRLYENKLAYTINLIQFTNYMYISRMANEYFSSKVKKRRLYDVTALNPQP